MNPRWYETFFHGIALDLWRAAVTPEQTRVEADFLEKVLRAPKGGRLLDVPCGNGRHAVALASRGYSVTGLDISDEFLAEAMAAAEKMNVAHESHRPQFRRANMVNLSLEGQFDGAYCWGNSFGYLDHADTVSFLSAVGRSLRSKARFVLQTGIAAESALRNWEPQRWYQIGDIYFLVENQYDARESRFDTKLTFIRDGKVDTREITQAVYTVAELRRMLTAAGLQPIAEHSDPASTPYALGAESLILIAEKA